MISNEEKSSLVLLGIAAASELGARPDATVEHIGWDDTYKIATVTEIDKEKGRVETEIIEMHQFGNRNGFMMRLGYSSAKNLLVIGPFFRIVEFFGDTIEIH